MQLHFLADMNTTQRAILVFFAFACLLSWIFWIPLALSRQGLVQLQLPMYLYFAGAFGPMIAALIVTQLFKISRGRDLLMNIFSMPRNLLWVIAATAIPLGIYLVAAGVAYLLSAKQSQVEFNSPSSVAMIFISFLLIVPGEEAGWRGFAIPTLQQKYSEPLATLIVWIMWGVWHIPAFFVGLQLTSFLQWTGVIAGFMVVLLPFSFLFTTVFNGSGQRTLIPIVLHASIAATSSITNIAVVEPVLFFSCYTIAASSIVAFTHFGRR